MGPTSTTPYFCCTLEISKGNERLEMQEGVTHGFASVHGYTIKTHNNLLHMMNFSRSWGYFKCKKIGEATPVDLQNHECYLSE